MPKVLVVNKSCHDLTAATEFGDIVFMSEGRTGRYSTGRMYRQIKPFIDESDAEDLILLSGLPTMQSVACSMFAFKHGRLNLLIHKMDRNTGKHIYVRREVMLDG